MDFSDIMASFVHDIKNSLSLILNNLDDLIANPDNRLADPRQASLLQHEAQRANSNLIQLLMLYKLGNEQLVVRVAEHNLEDFLEEIVADNQAICTALGLELTYRCDPELSGYFDWELIRGVLDSTIGNAKRYARSRILLSAAQEDDELVLRVEDDGDGFPDALLETEHDHLATAPEPLMTGRTRLGFYFAARIAALHCNAGKNGRIRLSNGHEMPGGCVELRLP